MRRFVVILVVASMALFAVGVQARDEIDNGRLVVKPYKHNHFTTGQYRMGKAELFGYIGELKDSKHITGIVLEHADEASNMQKHIIAETAKAQQLNAFVEADDKLVPLVDPMAPATKQPANDADGGASDH